MNSTSQASRSCFLSSARAIEYWLPPENPVSAFRANYPNSALIWIPRQNTVLNELGRVRRANRARRFLFVKALAPVDCGDALYESHHRIFRWCGCRDRRKSFRRSRCANMRYQSVDDRLAGRDGEGAWQRKLGVSSATRNILRTVPLLIFWSSRHAKSCSPSRAPTQIIVPKAPTSVNTASISD